MGLFNFSRKPKLTENERNIIKRAYEDVSRSLRQFDMLYFPLGDYINFRKYGYNSQQEAVDYKNECNVAEFMKRSNHLSYVIYNSELWYNKFKGTANHEIVDALGGLSTLMYRIKRKEYILSKHDDVFYPAAICRETPELTQKWFISLLEPLTKL